MHIEDFVVKKNNKVDVKSSIDSFRKSLEDYLSYKEESDKNLKSIIKSIFKSVGVKFIRKSFLRSQILLKCNHTKYCFDKSISAINSYLKENIGDEKHHWIGVSKENKNRIYLK